jgi:hypothetical protein
MPYVPEPHVWDVFMGHPDLMLLFLFTQIPLPMHTQIHLLLDETGSMQSIREDTLGGLNRFIEEQQAAAEEEGTEIDMTLWTFNSRARETRFEAVPIEEAGPLSPEDYAPRAQTPLIDASVETISLAEMRAAEDDPDQVVVALLTDGKENASAENTSEELEALIEKKREAGWEFVFLGVGIDAWDASRESGYASKAASTASADREEVSAALYSAAERVSDYASGKSDSVEIGDESEVGGEGGEAEA